MLVNETSIALVGLWALREIYSQWKSASALGRVDLERLAQSLQGVREKQIAAELILAHVSKDVDAAHAKIRELEGQRKPEQSR